MWLYFVGQDNKVLNIHTRFGGTQFHVFTLKTMSQPFPAAQIIPALATLIPVGILAFVMFCNCVYLIANAHICLRSSTSWTIPCLPHGLEI